MRIFKFLLIGFIAAFLLPAAASSAIWALGDHATSWRTADWSSAGLLPVADADREAAVYILSARTGGLKGAVSEHAWIVVKDAGASHYERWDKVGWGLPIRHNAYPADGRWYSNPPRIVFAAKGNRAETLISNIRAAIDSYPFASRTGYHIFPGPNSNSFVAHVMRQVPAIDVVLPPASIGRDYPTDGRLAFVDPDGRDIHLTLFGYAGFSAGWKSGLEINLLGLVAGLDLRRIGIKVPAFGSFALRER
ncbi:DUF3750 domain-containing protein [Jiella sp. MQZ9-1]|uniref:DUF3750 domain-containing protein n=1 Tax=Jiella flava TaxID=2816857 RepID=A0A939FYB3_9HYPH|nr:DUF3750 domain-containing protein [Jiella flava]MBO0661604.1 DUF3750 domain-containing protein [Jiella flava]MCD2470246.1 DUF3750 domain-containing protein [Jiella flava]